MIKQVEMIALRDFPLAQGESRRIVREGDRYSVPDAQVSFHENTGRGRRKAQPNSKKKGG